MHLLKSTLFTDIVAACGREDMCYVRNDGLAEAKVVVSIEAWAFTDKSKTQSHTYYVSVESGGIGTSSVFLI